MVRRRRLLPFVMALALAIGAPAAAYADDGSNNNQAPAPEWVYEPQEDASEGISLLSAGTASESAAADVVKVHVTAQDSETGETVPVPNAQVNLYVGADLKQSVTADENGYAEVPLSGLDLVDRMNASVSASAVVTQGKGINGNSRDKLFANLPKDADGDYYRYTLELHSETIDEHGNWGGQDLPVSYESNKVDIVFAIDATGSMSNEINAVKDNVAAFSEKLIASGLDIRFGIIEYRDIADGEKTVVHEKDGTHWLTDIDSVVEVLEGIEATGGGDTPETVLDALGYVADPDLSKWRSDAYRFCFVLTDAGIKVDNGYGYEGLGDAVDDLADDNVVTSVITSSGCRDDYADLIDATGGIYADINSSDFDEEMLELSTSIIDSVAKDMTLNLSEPRLLVNLTACYFADDKKSQSAEYRAGVENMLDEYANRLAETSDGHVLVDKMLVFSTDNRLDFYDTSKEASMADIRIEAEVEDDGTWWNNVQIHSNAYISGFFSDGKYTASYGGDDTEHFDNLKDGDELDGKQSFYRIQLSGLEGAGWNNSMIDDAYAYSTTVTHETGHYLFGFFDEYLNADGDNWRDVGGKPNSFYGLMDNQHDDIEMSRMASDYSYVPEDKDISYSQHTRQSWLNRERGFSCEGQLANMLSDAGYGDYFGYLSRTDFDTGPYTIKYTKASGANDRTATYSYAGLSGSDFLSLASTSAASISLMSAGSEDATVTQDAVAATSWKGADGSVALTITPEDGTSYTVEVRKSGDAAFTPVVPAEQADNLVATLPVAKGELAEVRLVANDGSDSVYNLFYVDRSADTSKGYFYAAPDNGTQAYVKTDTTSSYTFVADNTGYANGEYASVNQATRISSDNGAGFTGGEIYSVASYMADIDYTTISWFKYDGTSWKKLDTDLSADESMNIGARADLDGEGTYVLMAKKAPISGAATATDLSFKQVNDRDATVVLSFTDSNKNSKYYNVYYSESEFTDKDAEGVVVRSFDADSTDLTLNLIERNRVVYARVEIVLEDGTRSALSEPIRLEAGEADTDGDGIPDWWCDKYLLWGEPGEDKDIANSDDDGDGLTNLEEYKGGSDPTDPNDPVHTTNVPVESISLDPSELTVYLDGTGKLTVTFDPADATDKGVKWSIADTAVATIEAEGATCTVTGVSEGTTTVTAVSEDGGFSATATIAVAERPADPDPDPDVPVTPDPDEPDHDETCPSKAFSDIDTTQWYHAAVDWALKAGAMNGYENGTFGPIDPLTREQAAAVLWNLLGDKDVTAPAAGHADVDQGAWYADAVNWAVANGYMNGYDGTDRFGVGDALTREQFACVIANVAEADLDAADPSAMAKLPDAGEVSSWAEAAVAWAVQEGVVNGVETEDGRELQPGRTISRAEMAAMMMNAVDKGALEIE